MQERSTLKMFSMPTTHFMSNHFKDPSLFEDEKQLSVAQWSTKCRSRSYKIESDTLFVVSYAAVRVLIHMSGIINPNVRYDALTVKTVGKEPVI